MRGTLIRFSPRVICVLLMTALVSLPACGGGDGAPSAVPDTGPGTDGSEGPRGTIPARQPADLDGAVTDLALHPDGDVIVAGQFTMYGNRPVPPIIKMRPDGLLAPWVLGIVLADAPIETAVRPDGDIYVTQRQGEVSILWRLNADGTLDSAFRPVEFRLLDNLSRGLIFADLFHLEPFGAGGVYACGPFDTVNDRPIRGLVRLTPSGDIDGTFNSAARSCGKLVPLSDGRLYVTNYDRLEVNHVGASLLHRLNSDGSLDTSFQAVSFLSFQFNALLRDVALVPDDTGDLFAGESFVIGGAANVNPLFDPTAFHNLARINPDGSLDRDQPLPKLHPNVTQTPTVAVIAATIDGTGDTLMAADNLRRFRVDGMPAAFTIGDVSGLAIARILPLADGDAIIGGSFTTYNGVPHGRIVRITANGSLR